MLFLQSDIFIFILLPPPSVCSSRVSSCLSRLYQSLANLIRWSDQVMLEGVNLEDKEIVATVTTVIKAVLDGVKVLMLNRTLSGLVLQSVDMTIYSPPIFQLYLAMGFVLSL